MPNWANNRIIPLTPEDSDKIAQFLALIASRDTQKKRLIASFFYDGHGRPLSVKRALLTGESTHPRSFLDCLRDLIHGCVHRPLHVTKIIARTSLKTGSATKLQSCARLYIDKKYTLLIIV